MRRKAQSPLWAVIIQLAVVAIIVGVLYSASSQMLDGRTYEMDLHASERSLLAEAIAAKDTGVIQLHTFSSTDYETKLSESAITITSPGDASGKQERIHLPSSVSSTQGSVIGRGLRWVRTAGALSIQTLTADRECPLTDIDWQDVAVIGSQPEVEYVRNALPDPESVVVYERLSQRSDEDLFVRIDYNTENQTLLYTGVSAGNDYLRCVAAKELAREGIDLVVETIPYEQDQLHLLINNESQLRAVREGLARTFSEVMR